MTGLPSPLLERDRITTVVGPIDAEMVALTTAIAVSHKTGHPLIPGFLPEGPSDVTLYTYSGTWIDWKALVGDIASAARTAAPVFRLRRLSDPLVQVLARQRDPDASLYWDPLLEADVDAEFAAAAAAGRELPPLLTVVFGLHDAAGPGGEELMRQLYDSFRGRTALMVGVEGDAPWASDYGPVIELPDLHNSVSWRDLLAHVTGGDDAVERAPDERDISRQSELFEKREPTASRRHVRARRPSRPRDALRLCHGVQPMARSEQPVGGSLTWSASPRVPLPRRSQRCPG